MSNFDHKIRPGAEEELRARPNDAIGHHAAWEFSGDVWFDGEQFVEEVRRHHVLVATIKAASLEELMKAVNDVWGWE